MTPAAAATKRWKATPRGQQSVARYEASEKGRETRRRANRAWKQRNRDRVREHNRILERVRNAIAAGQLVKTACHCGRVDVQAHHHRGYAPAYELDVIWLCSRHHTEAHGRARQAA